MRLYLVTLREEIDGEHNQKYQYLCQAEDLTVALRIISAEWGYVKGDKISPTELIVNDITENLRTYGGLVAL